MPVSETLVGRQVANFSIRRLLGHGGMAEGASAIVGYINCSIFSATRIMTITTWGHTERHVSCSHMIDTAVRGQLLVRMAVQTMGRTGSCSYGVNNLLPRAVVAGGTGIMHLRIDRIGQWRRIAVAVGAASRVHPDDGGMIDVGILMDCRKISAVAGGAVAADRKGFAGRQTPQTSVAVVTGGT